MSNPKSLAREDSRQILRVRSYLMAAGTSVLVVVLLLAWHLLGMLRTGPFVLITTLIVGWVAVFYALFRTGLNRQAVDASLTVPQMAAASLTLLTAAFVADGGRAVFLVLLTMVLMFGVLRLRTRALLVYAAWVVAGYAGVIVLLRIFKPETLDLRLEVTQLLVLAVAMPWFALMGGYISALREELKSALHTVEDRERTLAEAQRLAHFGSWSFDAATQAVEWSTETYRIFGLDPANSAMVGAQFRSLVHEEDRDRYVQLIDRAVEGLEEFDAEYRIALPSGAVRWVHALAKPVTSRGRSPLLRGTVMDITERKAAEDRIRQLAHFDALTGLPNRNLFMQLLQHALAKTLRQGTPLALLFVDLDGFKTVNDTLGHDAGDLLLAAFAQRLRRCLRLSDVTARLGGDEFVVLIDDFDGKAEVGAVAERVMVAASTPYQIRERSCNASASIGIAIFPEAGRDIEALLRNADQAMYRAKHDGRGTFRFWTHGRAGPEAAAPADDTAGT
ncbi:Cyclic di-GMP phosphodiesterase Gmr (plasmid) [Variovorax sp. SRS16]|uniref:diguanylate cyclase domain-containing protein n=1 Tax=Variovorax sp. SRS16 TaxID=282217 RepID=UPI001318F1DD|nr:diguanylate cyclase [Variovorax sp. SRS16]VTU46167.1 Cyclic di-GMP phosphodiesterase Gmr [Variovorax sp. SRS16]